VALAVVGGLAVAGWFLGGGPKAPRFVRTSDQNVLLITIDTLRADALSCVGGRASTPNLDRLAALGLRFDFAHAHAVLTLPSHASILTGLYPFQHGVHDNAGFRLKPATPTLAALLRPRGVATGAFVGSFAVDSRFGLNNGFDVYDEHYGRSNILSGFTIPERRADAVVAAARTWITAQRGRWFAWVHVYDPHAPYRPPPPFDQRYAREPYFGEVAFTDSALAPLLDAARDPTGRPTFVVVTGDHGEGLGDHGEQTHGLFAYEATLRIPLILATIGRDTPSWEGAAGAPAGGAVSPLAARHVDIVPTILDALTIPSPTTLPGRTLLPGPAVPDATDRTSYFEALAASFNRGWAPLTGVLVNRNKYIDLPLPELYDLARDPREASNLVQRDLERSRAMENRLKAFGVSAPADRRAEDPESRARLQALGYVSGSAPLKARYTDDDDPKRLVGVDQQLRHAIELYEQRRFAEAILVYRQVIAERPAMEVAYEQLAMMQWDLGQPAEAIDTLRASVKAGAASVAVQTKLGTYLAETGQLKEAIPLLQLATSSAEPELDALNALGIALAKAGRAREAAGVFTRILALNPDNALALENLGSIALGERRTVDARRYFVEALAGDPSSSQAHNGLGVVELGDGHRQAAIDHFLQAVRADPNNFDALYNAATAMVNDGQLAAARPYLEQFARTAPPAFYADDIRRVREFLSRLSHR
jgi:arylsulfatase A-like enzyme/Tfp pilus assembly protein PilF